MDLNAILFVNDTPFWLVKLPNDYFTFEKVIAAVLEHPHSSESLVFKYLDIDKDQITFDNEEEYEQILEMRGEVALIPPVVFIYILSKDKTTKVLGKNSLNFKLRLEKFIRESFPEYNSTFQSKHIYGNEVLEILNLYVPQEVNIAEEKPVTQVLIEDPKAQIVIEKIEEPADQEQLPTNGINVFPIQSLKVEELPSIELTSQISNFDIFPNNKIDMNNAKKEQIVENDSQSNGLNETAIKQIANVVSEVQQRYQADLARSIQEVLQSYQPAANNRSSMSMSINPNLIFANSTCVICKNSPIMGVLYQSIQNSLITSCENCEDKLYTTYPDHDFRKVKQLRYFVSELVEVENLNVNVGPLREFTTNLTVKNLGTTDIHAQTMLKPYITKDIEVFSTWLGTTLRTNEKGNLKVCIKFRDTYPNTFKFPIQLECFNKPLATKSQEATIIIAGRPMSDAEKLKEAFIITQLREKVPNMPEELCLEMIRNNSFDSNKVFNELGINN